MSYPNTTAATLPCLHATPRGALRTTLRRIEAWFEARKRAAEDREVLASMSDRDLRDIGIERASVNAVADGIWLRG